MPHQDETAFQPIHSDELALSLPRRIRGLNQLIDDAVAKLCEPPSRLTKRGFLRASGKEGSGRYFGVEGVAGDFFLSVNYELWATRAETPLWLRIGSEIPIRDERLRAVVPIPEERRDGAGFAKFVPIYLKTGVEYEDILDAVVRRVSEIAEMIEES